MIIQKDIEHYIRTHQLSHSDWCDISRNYKLSEELIREYKDDVEWFYICKCQKLPEIFIREFPDKIWANEVIRHQELSPGFIEWIIHTQEMGGQQISWIKDILKSRGLYSDEYEKVIEKYDIDG